MTSREAGMLTLRQFYLLLAEWYNEQRLLDIRAYRFVVTQYSEAPVPGDVFPLLKETPKIRPVEEVDPDRDDVIFHMVTASMTVPSK